MQPTSKMYLFFFMLIPFFGQAQKKVSSYLLAQYNQTVFDRTLGNNPWGVGLESETYFNTATKLKPMIVLSGTIYLEDDKVYRANADGTLINDVRGVGTLFIGSLFQPTKKIYVALVAGPAIIGSQTLLGIQSSLGYYFSTRQRCTAKISYLNVFNRDKTTKQNFGTISIAIGFKLF